MEMDLATFSDDEDYIDDIRPAMEINSTRHDVVVGSSSQQRRIAKNAVSPLTRSISLMDDDEVDEYGYPIIKSLDDDEIESVHDENYIGEVGFKWRVRILRVLDSDEQWNGVCEIYFHWKAGSISENGTRRRVKAKERYSISSIEKPDKSPNFIILNEEDSNSIEDMYYTVRGFPEMRFGYLAWTVIVHERLELERYPYDRQFFKLEMECTNGNLVPWNFMHIPSVVEGRIEVGKVSCNFFAISETPSWHVDVLRVVKGNRQSVLTMNIGMTRLTGFYISNIALPYFLIGSAAVLTVAIEPEDYGTRFESMIALYLTLVAIKFVASFLPVINYSTLLDYYTLIAYLFLASWMVENFIVSNLFFGSDERDQAKRIDRICAYVYISLWLLLHLVIILGSTFNLFRKRWEEVEDDDNEIDPNTHKEVYNIED